MNRNDMSLTVATHDDLDAIVDLVNQAYRGTSPGGWTTEAGVPPDVNRDAMRLDRIVVYTEEAGAAVVNPGSHRGG